MLLPACSGQDEGVETQSQPSGSSGAQGLAGASGQASAGAGGSVAGQAAGGSGETSGSGGAGENAAGNGGGAGNSEEAAFVTEVVSFTPGAGAGHGQEQMPDIILGPPEGTGDAEGSTDVLSLGAGGEITLKLGVDVVDGPGPDLIVFENPFFAGGNPETIWKELGEVSVSEDGATWVTFPCDPAQFKASTCAGWRPVYSSSTNGVSPFDPASAGGDPFDLGEIGVSRARFVRIRDLSKASIPPTAGFDLDAIAVIHAGS